MTDTNNEELDAALRDDDPDVLLDVSELRVDEISLEVDDLRARVSLDADVLSLLKLHVGVEAQLARVHLTIKGVEAKLLLKVRLDNVARILDRVLTTIDNNPDIVGHLTEAAEEVGAGVGQPVAELGSGAASALEEVGDAAGTTVDDVAGEARRQRPRKGKPSRQAAQAEAPRRRRSAASPKKRPAQGSRSSRARRSKEG
jgi:hypothetical protein